MSVGRSIEAGASQAVNNDLTQTEPTEKANRGRGVFDPQALLRIAGSMRPFGSLFAKPGLGEPGGLYDAREACLINEIDLSYELVLAKLVE